MQAARVHDGGVLAYESAPDPEPKPGEVVVELRTAALNRRDLLVRKGIYPFPLPIIPGSDGAGVRRDTGEEVVILPALRWGEREDAPGAGFEILGGPTNGTYAELIAVPEENLYPKPAGFSWEEAAAFPLAGLTAYRAVFTRGALAAGETVLVLGAGSGVSTFAVQLAAQAGGRVLVTSSSAEKIERARELGRRRRPLRRRLGRAARSLRGRSIVITRSARRGGLLRDQAGAASSSSAPPGAPRRRCRCGRSTSAGSRCSGRRWAARATSRACWGCSTARAGDPCSIRCGRSPRQRLRSRGWSRGSTSASSC